MIMPQHLMRFTGAVPVPGSHTSTALSMMMGLPKPVPFQVPAVVPDVPRRPMSSVTVIREAAAGSLALIQSIRGGDVTAAAASVTSACAPVSELDLGRVQIQLDALTSHGLIATIITNSALALYTACRPQIVKNTDRNIDADASNSNSNNNSMTKTKAKIDNAIAVMFNITSIFSVISGLTITIICSLLGLYSKTALGMGKDDKFIQFFAQSYRPHIGSKIMVASLLSFNASFVMSVYLYFKDQGKISFLATALAFFQSVKIGIICYTIMTQASKFIM